ncbi:hypothetical protein I316_01004 [Kwoniella heveanensis BCC8398]|uniref:F-box domain-containing protein n=1 Tax=Kwoniella heveanensis BCC8398 TaxID=1296120 RepID=A0A1B9H1F5_9TREE|nr:hypothetical protein I316_01004 [Kwoniella heveanensis BCC8398]
MVQPREYRFQRTPLPLPYDLLHIITQELLSSGSLASLSKLSTLSREYHAMITPLLYTHVHIKTDEQLQAFLHLPYEKERRSKGSRALSVLGVKRGRSGSIKGEKYRFKIDALTLVKTLTLDIYPSRASLKYASKLPEPLNASTLTFTPPALESLFNRLSRSNSPRILATIWAGHLPSLIKPQKAIVDYAGLDGHMEAAENGQGWIDTMGGMSVGLQAWKESLRVVEIRGKKWVGILPAPGTKVTMVHTQPIIEKEEGSSAEVGAAGETASLDDDVEAPSQTTQPDSNDPSPELIEAIASRTKLIAARTEALTLALRTCQALHDASHSPAPLRWSVQDLIPHPVAETTSREHLLNTWDTYGQSEREIEARIEMERKIEYERERRGALDKILQAMDQVAPQIGESPPLRSLSPPVSTASSPPPAHKAGKEASDEYKDHPIGTKADERLKLPFELIATVINLVHDRATLAALARVSRDVADLVIERLYNYVVLDNATALVLFYTQVPQEKTEMVRILEIRHGHASDPTWQLPSALPSPPAAILGGPADHRMLKLVTLVITSVETAAHHHEDIHVQPDESEAETAANHSDTLFRLWIPALAPVGGPKHVFAFRIPSAASRQANPGRVRPQKCDRALLRSLVAMFRSWIETEAVIFDEYCLDFSDHENLPLVDLHRCRKLASVTFNVHTPGIHCEGEFYLAMEAFFEQRDALQGAKANDTFCWLSNQQVRFPEHAVHSHSP